MPSSFICLKIFLTGTAVVTCKSSSELCAGSNDPRLIRGGSASLVNYSLFHIKLVYEIMKVLECKLKTTMDICIS